MPYARSSLVFFGLAALAAGAMASPAAAATPTTTLASAKASEVAQIDARLFWSGVQGYMFATDKKIPASDQKTVQTGLASDITALKALRADVQKASSVIALGADRAKVANLAVFEFALPRIVTVRDSDNLAADEKAFIAKEAGYQTAIDKAAAAHKSVATAEQALAAFKSQVTLANVLSTQAHTAITLVRGASGAQTALAHDAADNFGAALHILAAIHDAKVITQAV